VKIKLMENPDIDSASYIEQSPSQVVDSGSVQFKAMSEAKKKAMAAEKAKQAEKAVSASGHKFDQKLGWIVPGEDPLVLLSKGMSDEDVARILGPTARLVSTKKPANYDHHDEEDSIDDLPPAARDAESRYGNL
jgi:hypothetical protein